MVVSSCCEDLASNRCTRPPSQLPASCVQWRSEMVYGYIKRHTAKIHYNLLPLPFTSWNKQPQQRRQRLIPLRRIQSSSTTARSVSTASGPPIARRAVVLAYASTTENAKAAGNAKAPNTASMTNGATGARNVAAPAYASMERDFADARSVAVGAYASTASNTSNAPSVRTSLAP